MPVEGLRKQADGAVATLRAAGTDTQRIEAKSAAGGLPRTTIESVSAFANGSGGLILLGLDEAHGFAAVTIDAPKLASDLASACSDQLDPPIRAEIDIVSIDGSPVVAALIDELPTALKPCFVKTLCARNFGCGTTSEMLAWAGRR